MAVTLKFKEVGTGRIKQIGVTPDYEKTMLTRVLAGKHPSFPGEWQYIGSIGAIKTEEPIIIRQIAGETGEMRHVVSPGQSPESKAADVIRAEREKHKALIPKYETGETLTPQQYQELQYAEMKSAESQLSAIQKMEAGIQPGQSYRVGKGIIEGTYLKHILKTKYIDLAEKQYILEQAQWQKSIKTPVGSTYVKTPTGYIMQRDVLKEAQAEWKTLTPAQQIGKTAYVAATHWPQILWEAFTSPFTSRDVKTYQKELIGWEKAQWERAKTGGIGGFIGHTLITPSMIEVYTLGTAKGLSMAIRPVTRGIIRTGVRLGTRISRFVPEEKLLTQPIISKIVKTPVISRAYQWAGKGYRFGYRLAPSGTIPVRKTISTSLFTGEKISQKLVSGRVLERVWLSPIAQKQAQKRIASMIGRRISIAFPKEDMISKIIRQETKLAGKRLVTRQTTLYMGMGLEPAKGGIGGFVRALPKAKIQTLFTGKGFTPLYTEIHKDIYGMFVAIREPAQLKVGAGAIARIRAIQKGLAQIGTRPSKITAFPALGREAMKGKAFEMATAQQEWIRKYYLKHPFKAFIESRRGIQIIVPKPSVEVLRRATRTGFAGGRLGIVQRLQAPIVMGEIPVVETGMFYMGVHEPVKTIIPEVKKIPMVRQFKGELFGYAPATMTGILPVLVSDVTTKVRQTQYQTIALTPKQMTKQMLSQQKALVQAQKQATVQPKFQITQFITPSFLPFMLPHPTLYGRGEQFYDYDLWGLQYRKREFKIPSIQQLFGIKKRG